MRKIKENTDISEYLANGGNIRRPNKKNKKIKPRYTTFARTTTTRKEQLQKLFPKLD
jgi:hypothetical protein